MKYFKIFAVGLIISAVVIATAIAPVINAAAGGGSSTTQYSFSNKLFALPAFDITGFNKTAVSVTTTSTSTTGPTLDPPDASVTPNFSGLVVEGTTTIDGNDDDVDDLIIDDNGKLFINNRFEVDGDDDGNPELDVIGNDSLILGEYSAGAAIVIDNQSTTQVLVNAYDSSGFAYFSVYAPFVKFFGPSDIDFEIEGDLEVDGKIQSAEAIGSYYINKKNFSGYNVTVSCDTDDYLTGCSGYAGSSAFKGSIPDGISCTAYRSSSGTINAYATCFDPVGVKSGTYDLS